MTKVEIYTKGHCPFCHRAKALLEQKGIAYQEFEVDLQSIWKAKLISTLSTSTLQSITTREQCHIQR